MPKRSDVIQWRGNEMSVNWDDLFAPMRAEVGPVFDVRNKVMQRLVTEAARQSDDRILKWLMIAAVTAASLVWAVALPRLITPPQSHVSYVALIESLDVTSEIYAQR